MTTPHHTGEGNHTATIDHNAAVAGIYETISWGWDTVRVAHEVNALRQQTIRGMPAAGLGDPWQVGELLFRYPETWKLLIRGPEQIVGFWHFVSLDKEHFRSATQGKLTASRMTADTARAISTPGWHDIYVLTFCISPNLWHTPTSLGFGKSFFDDLISLTKRDVFIDLVCANFATTEGLSLAKGLNFKDVGAHSVRGRVFLSDLASLVRHSREKQQGLVDAAHVSYPSRKSRGGLTGPLTRVNLPQWSAFAPAKR